MNSGALSVSAAVLPFVNRLAGLPGDRLSEPSAQRTVLGLVLPLLLLSGGVVAFMLVKRADLLATVSGFILIPLLAMGVVSFCSIPLRDPGVFSREEGDLRKNGTVTTEGLTLFDLSRNVFDGDESPDEEAKMFRKLLDYA